MQLGPLNATVISQTPLKSLSVAVASKVRHSVVFDGTHPHNMSSDVLGFDVDIPCLGATPALSRAAVGQVIEICQNTEWHRAGFFVQCRADGVADVQDGWYVPEHVNVPEVSQTQGWANATVTLAQRARQGASVGIWNDQKVVADDIIHGGGTALLAYPMGLTTATAFPLATYTYVGRDGNIAIVEGSGAVMRAPLANPVQTMTLGRCAVTDEPSAGGGWEVFWRDHRLQNDCYRFTNTLLRVTVQPGVNTNLIEVWSGGVWTTLGSLQYQSYNGSTYSVLPLQGVNLGLISGDEVNWEERRYDAASSSFVRILYRIRRGSRIIEAQIVTASGTGLAGAQSFGIVQAGTWVLGTAADTSGVAWTQAANLAVPGFAYLNSPAFPASTGAGGMWSGLSVPAGQVGRIGIVCGLQDAQWTTLGATSALYASKMAAYNRVRVKQRILVGS